MAHTECRMPVRSSPDISEFLEFPPIRLNQEKSIITETERSTIVDRDGDGQSGGGQNNFPDPLYNPFIKNLILLGKIDEENEKNKQPGPYHDGFAGSFFGTVGLPPG